MRNDPASGVIKLLRLALLGCFPTKYVRGGSGWRYILNFFTRSSWQTTVLFIDPPCSTSTQLLTVGVVCCNLREKSAPRGEGESKILFENETRLGYSSARGYRITCNNKTGPDEALMKACLANGSSFRHKMGTCTENCVCLKFGVLVYIQRPAQCSQLYPEYV